MTTSPTIDDIVRSTCTNAGLDISSLELMSNHATPVYRLRALDIVVRVARGDDRDRAALTVEFATWLVAQHLPVTEPVLELRPVEREGATVTFWRFYDQGGRTRPGAAALGEILRDLHKLPSPPVDLPSYQPLTRLGEVLAAPNWLSPDDQAWLSDRRQELLNDYATLPTHLGVGAIHGDAYPGNTLWAAGDRVVLGDWDEAATGLRELDLVNTHQGARMGRSQAERDAFTAAYGWDITTWPGWHTLRALRDLHTLAAFIQRGNAGDDGAAAEVRHRVSTLRNGDEAARWNPA